MCRDSRKGSVCLAASRAALEVTVENTRSLASASSAGDASKAVPLASARCRIRGPNGGVSALISNAYRRSIPADRRPPAIADPASPNPMNPMEGCCIQSRDLTLTESGTGTLTSAACGRGMWFRTDASDAKTTVIVAAINAKSRGAPPASSAQEPA